MSHGYCDWCGKPMPTVGGIYGGFGGDYCTNKCKHEAEAAEREREREAKARKRKEYDDDDDDDSQSLGFFGRLFRTIKRVIYTIAIIYIAYLIYSYCKSKGLL